MVKLSMPVGLLMESALAGGVSGERLLEVIETKDYEALRHVGKEESSWTFFFEFAEQNRETVVSAITSGYTFKFITIRGLLNLLQTKYKLKENEDFLMNESGIDMNLSDEQLDFLRSRIPSQWVFKKQEQSQYCVQSYLAQTISTSV
ncbi:hypothetical protein IHV10_07105 [Fictibacillus sp. 5RED26]|uniref:hypothetical protein n=1 Tax=unclassified Fictibacillus TaxID=2644029 RepID=UPI0018CECFF3|nr:MULTISPECIES: hypothetical protein [unclassified Fictibacillus]MBH0156128.1 hypothetical protein [Fictibacillus sp. 5RED26]MBH0165651.1 hypothetical protein [Fictibacillus sp. 7GRE50]